MEPVVVANRPAVALAEAQTAVEEAAAASERPAVVAMPVVRLAVELAAPAAGVAVSAKAVAAGSADTKGPQELGSPGSKSLLCLRLERQEIGLKSIALGFALVAVGADFGKDCSGSFVVADKPHYPVELS